MWRLLIAVEVGVIAYAFGCAWFSGRVAAWWAKHPNGVRIRFKA